MRHLSIASVLLIAAIVPVAMSPATYPVRVSFAFDYDGRHYETSYLTTITKVPNQFVSRYRWQHARDKTSILLPDRSLMILSAEWPFEWTDFEPNIPYTNRARWFWLNNVDTPTEIVSGNAATRIALARRPTAPFLWIDVIGTIERVGNELSGEAARSDKLQDRSDRLLFSNLSGGSEKSSGILFTSVSINPVVGVDTEGKQRIAQMRSASGWSSVGGNCRIKPAPPLVQLAGLVTFSTQTTLLPNGGNWIGDDGPHPGEPVIMYRTEERFHGDSDNGFSVAPYRAPALQLVHAVEWNGQLCTNIAAPVGATAELVEFQDGRVVLLQPTDQLAVLRP